MVIVSKRMRRNANEKQSADHCYSIFLTGKEGSRVICLESYSRNIIGSGGKGKVGRTVRNICLS